MSNPRRRHSHRRRNPAFFGVDFPSVKTIAFAGIGFAGPSFVSGFLTTTVPTIMTTITNMGILGKYVVRIGAVVGLAALTKRFVGSQEAQAVMIGGTANIALTAINDFVPGILPANPLALYVPLMQAPGVRSMNGMKQYVPLRGLRAIPNAAPFASRSGAFQGSAIRFQRY